MTGAKEPMLAAPADPRVDVFNDDQWVTELKMDGQRRLVTVDADGAVAAYGRDGARTYLPQSVTGQLSCCLMGVQLDGELLGEQLVVFDIPSLTAATPYDNRRAFLEGLFERWIPDLRPNIRLVPVAHGTEAKMAMALRVRDEGGEGLVAKRRTSLYQYGRRSRDWMKLKRQYSVDCVVLSIGEEKLNMIVGVLDGHKMIEFEVGRTVGDGPIAQPGDVIEVSCLYVTDDDRLYQPVVRRIRKDKRPNECTADQLVGGRTNKNLVLEWEMADA